MVLPGKNKGKQDPVIVKVDPEPAPTPAVSLDKSAGEAGTALASLTKKTADETVAHGRLLLPTTFSAPPLATDAWQQTLDPPAESLREAGQNMSAGLEPMTSSARRAVTLFLRETPGLASGE